MLFCFFRDLLPYSFHHFSCFLTLHRVAAKNHQGHRSTIRLLLVVLRIRVASFFLEAFLTSFTTTFPLRGDRECLRSSYSFLTYWLSFSFRMSSSMSSLRVTPLIRHPWFLLEGLQRLYILTSAFAHSANILARHFEHKAHKKCLPAPFSADLLVVMLLSLPPTFLLLDLPTHSHHH